jgi:hypothetical protein
MARNPLLPTVRDLRRGVSGLRFDAYHAHLDGRTARAKELNSKADQIERDEVRIRAWIARKAAEEAKA